MKFKLLGGVLLLSFIVKAQEVDLGFNKKHTTYLGSESVTPFVISQIQIGLNTKVTPSFSLSLKSNSGNTMVHNTDLRNYSGGERTVYFNAVLEKTALAISYPFHKKMELFFEMSLNSASRRGIFNPMSWAVQDDFIESIHSIAGKTDIYKRAALGFNAFNYSYTDESGNQYTVAPNSIFLIPLVLGTNYYEVLYQSDQTIISINSTLSLKIPVKSPAQLQAVEAGAGFTLNRTKKTGARGSFTTAIHGSLYHHELTTNNDYIPQDNAVTYKVSGLLGLNFIGKKQHMWSLFTALEKTSSRLQEDNYYLVFDSYENRLALTALTQGNEYINIGSNYTYHFKNRNSLSMEITFREDLNFKRGVFKILKGRNAEDFGVFLGFRYSIR